MGEDHRQDDRGAGRRESASSLGTGRSLHLFLVFAAAGALFFVLCGVWSRFHARLADFWIVLHYARGMRWAEPASWYCGFYPIGYALFLRLFPEHSVVFWAYILNAILAGLAVAAVAMLVAAAAGRRWGIAGFVAGLSHPLVFVFANTPGADIGAAAFTSLAVYLLWKDAFGEGPEPPRARQLMAAGLLLGLAALWRSHCVVSSAALIVAYCAVFRRRLSRRVLMLPFMFGLVFAVQPIVNVWSGHGLFATAQRFNVYKMMHGIDWWHPPREIRESVFELIVRNPRRFLEGYVPFLVGTAILGWPAVLCARVAEGKPAARFAAFALLGILVYAVPVGLGGSGRGPVVMGGLFTACFVLLIAAGVAWIRAAPGLIGMRRAAVLSALGFLVGVQLLQWLREDWFQLRTFRRRREVLGKIEETLVARGLRDAREVFTDLFRFYLPSVPPFLPNRNGGWARYAVRGFNDTYPELPVGSPDEFFAACRTRGIRFLVLTPDCRHVAGWLHRLYSHSLAGAARGVEYIGQRGVYRVFAVLSDPL